MGPLQGIRIIELAGLGPAPFCAMMLADMGATVIRVDRASAQPGEPDPVDTLLRNRRSIALNLKSPAGIAALLRLIDGADALIEGFRPGVAERLGVGPDVCLARNPKLVYGRMTGWGQSGPLAHSAGHDINYLALTGALHLIGERGRKPVPPLNLVADFGGGGMMLLVRPACGPAGSLALRQGPGDRCRHDRRRHRVAQHLSSHARCRSRVPRRDRAN